MKHGANPTDLNRIAELAEEGLDAEEISEQLKIVLSCVESFIPNNDGEDLDDEDLDDEDLDDEDLGD